MNPQDIIKLSAEQRFAEELAIISEHDHAPKPQGWLRSPRAVRQFILGDEKLAISRKFYCCRICCLCKTEWWHR